MIVLKYYVENKALFRDIKNKVNENKVLSYCNASLYDTQWINYVQ